MTATKDYIKKINVSTFKGTICLSEKEFERHLSTFAYQRALNFLMWDDSLATVDALKLSYEELWNEFLKEEEYKITTK